MTLTGMSLFVIADITNPKSSPLELQTTVPNYMIPFVPIIQEGERPFVMFKDLQGQFDWVLDTLEYDSESTLVQVLDEAVIHARRGFAGGCHLENRSSLSESSISSVGEQRHYMTVSPIAFRHNFVFRPHPRMRTGPRNPQNDTVR